MACTTAQVHADPMKSGKIVYAISDTRSKLVSHVAVSVEIFLGCGNVPLPPFNSSIEYLECAVGTWGMSGIGSLPGLQPEL